MNRNRLIPLQMAFVIFILTSCDVLKNPPKPPGLKAPGSQKLPSVPSPNAAMLHNVGPISFHYSNKINSMYYYLSK